MGNERLRNRMAVKGLTAEDLASAIEVDPKTIERWLRNGRIPRQPHRRDAADVLDSKESYLWPALLDDAHYQRAAQAEILQVFSQRSAVPTDLWRRLADDTTEQIDVLVYAGLFMLDTNSQLPQQVASRASQGLKARFLYGDPDSQTVAWRGEEEGIGEDLAARIRLSLKYMSPVAHEPGIELRLHQSILYNSIYRFDDEMLVNTHVAGSPAGQNPVLHLRRLEDGHLFDHYMMSFERVWQAAVPWQPAQS